MRILLLIAVLAAACRASELLVTKEYTEQQRKTAPWEVVDYEQNIFRGWSVEDFRSFLGFTPTTTDDLPLADIQDNLPSALSWQHTACDHGPKDQDKCGGCWAFAVAGMVASRCCLHTKDQGWLSPQELISCDSNDNGCNGGSPRLAANYVMLNAGLVPDACFPFKDADAPCPYKCENGKDWKSSHVCDCQGVMECRGTKRMKSCLQTGPITVGFKVCQSFTTYKSGIYACDCQQYLGNHAVLVQGYKDEPKCHWIVRNSWGTVWGEGGYFKIECDSCGINGDMSGGNVMCKKVE